MPKTKIAAMLMVIGSFALPTTSFAASIKWCGFSTITGKQVGTQCFTNQKSCNAHFRQNTVECVAVSK